MSFDSNYESCKTKNIKALSLVYYFFIASYRHKHD